MSVRKRKPLNDALSEFVFGTSEPTSNPTSSESLSPESLSVKQISSHQKQQSSTPELLSPESSTPEASPVKESIMSKLQIAEKEATVRFTVDMSKSLHRKLSILAAKTGRKKVDIVRIFLEEGLKNIEI